MTSIAGPSEIPGSKDSFGEQPPFDDRAGLEGRAAAAAYASLAGASSSEDEGRSGEELVRDALIKEKTVGIDRASYALIEDLFWSRCDFSKIRDVSLLFEALRLSESQVGNLAASAQIRGYEEGEGDGVDLAEAIVRDLFMELERRPFSLDLVEGLVNRRGKPISPPEERLMVRLERHLPDLNRARASWELLQRETDRMALDLALGNSSFQKMNIRVGGETFSAHGISGSPYRFLVHASGPEEGTPEEVLRERNQLGFVCTSVVSDNNRDFYEQHRKFGIVLSADAGAVAKTIREDGYTPYDECESPNEFYRFSRRLQLLTGAIDRLYRESGVQGVHVSDSFSRMNRLLSARELDPAAEQQIEQLRGGRNNQQLNAEYCLGLAWKKVEELESSGRIQDPERKREFERCKSLLQEIMSDATVFNRHIHPILPPEELLRQTPFQSMHRYNKFGERPFNEINLDLGAGVARQDLVAVRAVLFDRKALETRPGDFLPILKDAKEKGIPILLKEDLELPPEAIRGRLICAVENGNPVLARKLLATGAIDRTTAERAFEIAVGIPEPELIQMLVETELLSDEKIEAAFDSLIKEGYGNPASRLLKCKPELLRDKAIQSLFQADWPSPSIAVLCHTLYLQGISFPERIAYKVFSIFVEENRPDFLEDLIELNKNRLSREDRRKWACSLFKTNPDLLPSLLNPAEDADWAISRILKTDNFPAFKALAANSQFILNLSPELAERAFAYAAQHSFRLSVDSGEVAGILPEFWGELDAPAPAPASPIEEESSFTQKAYSAISYPFHALGCGIGRVRQVCRCPKPKLD